MNETTSEYSRGCIASLEKYTAYTVCAKCEAKRDHTQKLEVARTDYEYGWNSAEWFVIQNSNCTCPPLLWRNTDDELPPIDYPVIGKNSVNGERFVYFNNGGWYIWKTGATYGGLTAFEEWRYLVSEDTLPRMVK